MLVALLYGGLKIYYVIWASELTNLKTKNKKISVKF